ncbi:MAG: response regulator transcription factor [Planctomycetes bacterium]|nr:response regulator transcription factor [Planctomycetota bacterium]
MRILLIEDNEKLARIMATALREQGHALDRSSDGVDGLHLALSEPYDLLIVDLGLPELSGLEVLRRVRADGTRDVPILVVTARDSVEDRVRGLDSGADDYLVKPFAVAELLARVRALLRRGSGSADAVLKVGETELDPARRRVRHAGEPVELSPREFSLLEYFMRRPGVVLSRSMILEHVWDYRSEILSNVIDVHVRRIRKKLGDPAGERTILTRRGMGYCFGQEEP